MSDKKEEEPPTTIIPEVEVPVMDKDEKIAQAQMGNPKQQEAKYFMNEKDQKVTVEQEGIKYQSTLFFKNCQNCEYIISALCTKILIDGCSNTRIVFNGKVVTNVIEIWRCNNFHILANTKLHTMQIDMCRVLTVEFAKCDFFHSIVWAGTHDLSIKFTDAEEHNLIGTGYTQMKEIHPDLNEQTDQIHCRFIKGKLASELVVRLQNGFPSTEREAKEFDAKQEAAIKQLAKEAGINIKRKVEKKPGRNEPCDCGSGKKYKNCHGQ